MGGGRGTTSWVLSGPLLLWHCRTDEPRGPAPPARPGGPARSEPARSPRVRVRLGAAPPCPLALPLALWPSGPAETEVRTQLV